MLRNRTIVYYKLLQLINFPLNWYLECIKNLSQFDMLIFTFYNIVVSVFTTKIMHESVTVFL